MPPVPPDTLARGTAPARLLRARKVPARVRLRRARAEMARRSTDRLDVRVACLDVVKDLPIASAAPVNGVSGPVWQYWSSGVDAAPPLVRRCLESVDEHLTAPVLRLSDRTIADYVALPGYVRRRDLTPAHFSDVLRVHLLAEHGGTWVDATVLVTGPVPADVRAAPFFAFTRPADPFLLSSWFVRAQPGHRLVVGWRDALDRYWSQSSTQSDYFLLHHLFEALVTVHQPLRDDWTRVPHHSFREPHLVQEHMLEPFRAEELRQTLASSWLHKLTYRYPERPEGSPLRVVDALERGREGWGL